MIRAQPMDAVVLVGGCDKTVPAQMMAAVSAGIPALLVVGGPMLTGYWRRSAAGRLHGLPPFLGGAARVN